MIPYAQCDKPYPLQNTVKAVIFMLVSLIHIPSPERKHCSDPTLSVLSYNVLS